VLILVLVARYTNIHYKNVIASVPCYTEMALIWSHMSLGLAQCAFRPMLLDAVRYKTEQCSASALENQETASHVGLLITNYSAINTKLQQITAF
jgi:hypothetical protein